MSTSFCSHSMKIFFPLFLPHFSMNFRERWKSKGSSRFRCDVFLMRWTFDLFINPTHHFLCQKIFVFDILFEKVFGSVNRPLNVFICWLFTVHIMQLMNDEIWIEIVFFSYKSKVQIKTFINVREKFVWSNKSNWIQVKPYPRYIETLGTSKNEKNKTIQKIWKPQIFI